MAFSDLVGLTDRAVRTLLGGESITYAPLVGSPVVITGIFSAPFELVKGSPDFGVEATGPSVWFRRSDLPADPETDTPTITIGAAPNRPASLTGAYSVVGREPDDEGGIVLRLRK